MKISQSEFRKLTVEKRYTLLKKEGDYVGARSHGVHRIHLFAICGFYAEVWIVISLNQVHWIEIQENQSVLAEYASQIDVRKELDL
jgi:hypothetical protein